MKLNEAQTIKSFLEKEEHDFDSWASMALNTWKKNVNFVLNYYKSKILCRVKMSLLYCLN